MSRKSRDEEGEEVEDKRFKIILPKEGQKPCPPFLSFIFYF